MRAKINTIFMVFIVLGTIGVALNILFGNRTMIFVEKNLIDNTTYTWYTFNVKGYLDQIQASITNTTELQLNPPTKQMWTVDINNWGDAIVHNIKVVVDYIIFIINIILYPFKIGGYMFRFIISILGLNYNDPESSIYWMGILANGLVNVEIPFTT